MEHESGLLYCLLYLEETLCSFLRVLQHNSTGLGNEEGKKKQTQMKDLFSYPPFLDKATYQKGDFIGSTTKRMCGLKLFFTFQGWNEYKEGPR